MEVRQTQAEQTDGPNSHASGTSGTSPAEQAWVPEASGNWSSGTFGNQIMTCYVRRSYPAKKNDILHKRENALLHSIQSNLSSNKLDRAAEKVREAHLSVFKGLIYYAKDVGTLEQIDTQEIKKAEAGIVEWSNLSSEEIVVKYRKQTEQTDAANSRASGTSGTSDAGASAPPEASGNS